MDASENRCNKHILQSGIAEKTTAEEDPRDSGHIWVHAGETRDVLCVMLMRNNFTFVITDYRLQSVMECTIFLMKKNIIRLQHMRKMSSNMLLQSVITVLPQLSLMLRRS